MGSWLQDQKSSKFVWFTFRLARSGLHCWFYGDFRTHNVRKVRVLKYTFVHGQIKAADQKYWQKEKWQWKICETSFWTRGFIENLDYFWARYCRAKVLDFSCVVETLLPIELTPNFSNVVRKNMLFQMTKKLTKERLWAWTFKPNIWDFSNGV